MAERRHLYLIIALFGIVLVPMVALVIASLEREGQRVNGAGVGSSNDNAADYARFDNSDTQTTPAMVTSDKRHSPSATGEANDLEIPDIAPNPPVHAPTPPHWLTGATQSEFRHKFSGLPLVPDESDLDPEDYIERNVVKDAYGFANWSQGTGRLVPGLKFSVEVHSELTTFSLLLDRTRACFEGPRDAHGVRREIELRREQDKAAVSITIIVALSISTAQEQLVPVLHRRQEGVLASNASRINKLSLGDANDHSEFPDGQLKRIAFTRDNVYVEINADSGIHKPIAGLDLLAFATEIDRNINSIDRVGSEGLDALRPRLSKFELGANQLSLSTEKTNRCALSWSIEQARECTYSLEADSNGDLLFDSISKPTSLRGTLAGSFVARLVVIDEFLLFDWRDRQMTVTE